MSQYSSAGGSSAISKTNQVGRASKWPHRKHNKRERKVLQTAMKYTPSANGNWAVVPAYVDDALDQLAAQSSGGLQRTVAVTWDFSVAGGAIGTIDLGAALPNAAVVTQVVTDVQTTTTGGGSGTITLNVPTDGNLCAAVSNGQATETVAQFKTSPVKTTAQRELQATIATQSFTAGKITWFVTYVQSA